MSGGAVVLVLAMVPMVVASWRDANTAPPIGSTLPIGTVLWIYAITMSTLGLRLSAITTAVQAGLWFWLLVVRIYFANDGSH